MLDNSGTDKSNTSALFRVTAVFVSFVVLFVLCYSIVMDASVLNAIRRDGLDNTVLYSTKDRRIAYDKITQGMSELLVLKHMGKPTGITVIDPERHADIEIDSIVMPSKYARKQFNYNLPWIITRNSWNFFVVRFNGDEKVILKGEVR